MSSGVLERSSDEPHRSPGRAFGDQDPTLEPRRTERVPVVCPALPVPRTGGGRAAARRDQQSTGAALRQADDSQRVVGVGERVGSDALEHPSGVPGRPGACRDARRVVGAAAMVAVGVTGPAGRRATGPQGRGRRVVPVGQVAQEVRLVRGQGWRSPGAAFWSLGGSQPVPQPGAAVRVPGALVGGAGGVPADHLPRPPPGEAHQVGLLPAGGQPAVGEGVPEQVRVESSDPGVVAAPLEHLPRPRSRSADPRLPSHSAGARPAGAVPAPRR